MKKNILLFVFSAFFASSLFAGSLYIKVAALTHSDTLFSLQYQLKEMGYKTYITQNEEWYRVYTGPFRDKREAQVALKQVRHKISRDAYITALEIENETVVSTPVAVEEFEEERAVEAQTQENVNTATSQKSQVSATPRTQKKEVLTQNQSSNDFYVGASVGASKFAIARNGNLPLDISMRSYGPSYGVEAGYYITPNIFSSLNYQKSELRNCDFNAMFVTLNYQFDKIGTLSPYIGVLGGVSKLAWSKNPVVSSGTDLNLDSAVMGVQLGGDIEIYGNISTFMYYRYMSMDFNTVVSSGNLRSQIEHNSQQDFNLGLKYKF